MINKYRYINNRVSFKASLRSGDDQSLEQESKKIKLEKNRTWTLTGVSCFGL